MAEGIFVDFIAFELKLETLIFLAERVG